MNTPAKRIAILTSGGDCAGLNAVIRAVVLRAETLNWEVIGIMDGTHGLLENPPHVMPLRMDNVDTVVMRQGGTILGTTNKGDPFAYPMPDGTLKDRSGEIIDAFKKLGCEALIGIGGDGSLAILSRLAKQGGFPLIGIPKTIDNDLGVTEMSVGFDTAVAVATEALDRLQPTAASHDRIMVLEVMGRDAGHIALTAGIAGGADVILIPEIPYSITNIAAHIKILRQRGRNFALVVVSEAVKTPDGDNVSQNFFGGQKRLGGIGHIIGAQIAEACQAETRVTVLGHVQRGGQPSAHDRLLASAFGVYAVNLIQKGQFDRMVAWHDRSVIDVSIADAIKHYQCVEKDGTLVKTARGLGICLGDETPLK
ncbi:MAG: ATP-dependent 6-phosphofructokinase [Alphaproteobacteria bacterium]|nr:ATP-dependent 6-phosphofructokinase [Alphaproteobacteria bacterium]